MNIQTILRNSEKALCGEFERQVSVKPSQVSQVKSTLRQNGYIVVGDGPGNFGNINIWFSPTGWSL